MEAIKKKVQAMKVEKDNLCDRCDEVEQVMVIRSHGMSPSNYCLSSENEGGSDPP